MKWYLICSFVFATLIGSAPEAMGETTTKEVWKGSGAVFDQNGKQLASYELEVSIEEKSPGLRNRLVKVTMADGSVDEIVCSMRGDDDAWSVSCESDATTTKGGGYCFGEGLCQEYEEVSPTHAFATTVIEDDDNGLRLMRTELRNGVAVAFYREKLRSVVR